MYLIPCIKTCYGPGIMGKKDVSANTHQNSRVIRDGSRCQITNAFTDFSNQMTMFLVWPLDGGSAPFTLSSLPLQLRTCHPLLSLGPSTWLLHVPPPPPPPAYWDGSRRRGTGCASAVWGSHAPATCHEKNTPREPLAPEREAHPAVLTQDPGGGTRQRVDSLQTLGEEEILVLLSHRITNNMPDVMTAWGHQGCGFFAGR